MPISSETAMAAPRDVFPNAVKSDDVSFGLILVDHRTILFSFHHEMRVATSCFNSLSAAYPQAEHAGFARPCEPLAAHKPTGSAARLVEHAAAGLAQA